MMPLDLKIWNMKTYLSIAKTQADNQNVQVKENKEKK